MMKIKFDYKKESGKICGVNFRTGPHKNKRDKRKQDKLRKLLAE